MTRDELINIDNLIGALWPKQWDDATDEMREIWKGAIGRYPHQAVVNAVKDVYRQKPDRLPSVEKMQAEIGWKLPQETREQIDREKPCMCWECVKRRHGRHDHHSREQLAAFYCEDERRRALEVYGEEDADAIEAHEQQLQITLRQPCLRRSSGEELMRFRDHVAQAADDDPIKRVLHRGGGLSGSLNGVDEGWL